MNMTVRLWHKVDVQIPAYILSISSSNPLNGYKTDYFSKSYINEKGGAFSAEEK